MPSKRKRLLAVLLTLFALIFGFSFWNWPYTPLRKAIAWANLKTGQFDNVSASREHLKVLLEGQEFASGSQNELLYLRLDETILDITEKTIPFSGQLLEDEHFLVGKTYTFPSGQDGISELETRVLLIEGRETVPFSVEGILLREPINQTVYAGKRAQEDIAKELQGKWGTLINALKKKSTSGVDELLTAAEVELFSKTAKLSDMDYRLAPSAQIAFAVGAETNDTIQVGTLTLKQKNCMKGAEIPIVYLKDQRSYRFDGVYAALATLCAKPKELVAVLACSNCWLAPVGKKQSLSSTYAPYVVYSGLSGGTYVTPDTKAALTKLFVDAKAKGITTIRVSSGFRSYSWQESLFNTYVNNEKKYGLTTAQAIEKANSYSAKPGHSEHQLGTTVDLMACKSPCSFYDSANNPLFSYLNANAHKFGFIISYPNGSQPTTGYVYEPWHVRYVGTDLAIELYNNGYLTKKGYYLEQFLREKGKY